MSKLEIQKGDIQYSAKIRYDRVKVLQNLNNFTLFYTAFALENVIEAGSPLLIFFFLGGGLKFSRIVYILGVSSVLLAGFGC